MRKTTVIVTALALLAGLTACTSSDAVQGCSPTVHSGKASSVVKATGAFGKAPKVTNPTPLYTKTTEKSTLIAGHGAPITVGQPVLFNATVTDARTGAVLDATTYSKNNGALASAGIKYTIPAMSNALVCAQVGERIAVVASPKDGNSSVFGATGVKKTDSVVIVIDVRRTGLAKANGASQAPNDSLPNVVLAPSGAPGIQIPSTAAPKKLTTQLLKAGSGSKTNTKEYVLVQYTAVNWGVSPAVVNSTWKNGGAGAIVLGSDAVSPGLSKALLGQRVGSQVMAVIPASQATSADAQTMTDDSGQPLVYVVDILGVIPQ